MFTTSQTIQADKLTTLNRGWRQVDSMRDENGEKAAFIKLRFVSWLTKTILWKNLLCLLDFSD